MDGACCVSWKCFQAVFFNSSPLRFLWDTWSQPLKLYKLMLVQCNMLVKCYLPPSRLIPLLYCSFFQLLFVLGDFISSGFSSGGEINWSIGLRSVDWLSQSKNLNFQFFPIRLAVLLCKLADYFCKLLWLCWAPVYVPMGVSLLACMHACVCACVCAHAHT